MPRPRRYRALVLLLLLLLPVNGLAAEPALLDEQSGLALDEHLELVRANCTGCHSAGLITRARLSREDWTATLRWMQRTQGLWQFPPVTEGQILDYLATHYGPREITPRRRPLGPHLVPPGRTRLTPPN